MVQRAEYVKKYYSDPVNRERRARLQKAARSRLKDRDPVAYKATHMVGGLRMGRGGAARMVDLINRSVGKPCPYCGTELTMKVLSLDHKTPWHKKTKKTQEEIDALNSASNLHIVCKPCNQAKGNLTHEEYTSLLEFLEDKPRMKQIVIAKMKGGNFMYRKRP